MTVREHKNKPIREGFWKSQGNNLFWLRIVGEEVYWLGMNGMAATHDLGERWCHVGHGKQSGNTIQLTWADIPVGEDRLHGSITIEIIDETRMKVVEDTGDFGRSEWTWQATHKNFSELGR